MILWYIFLKVMSPKSHIKAHANMTPKESEFQFYNVVEQWLTTT